MPIAQFLLALPIVVALSHRAMTGVWQDYGDQLLVDGSELLPGHSPSLLHRPD